MIPAVLIKQRCLNLFQRQTWCIYIYITRLYIPRSAYSTYDLTTIVYGLALYAYTISSLLLHPSMARSLFDCTAPQVDPWEAAQAEMETQLRPTEADYNLFSASCPPNAHPGYLCQLNPVIFEFHLDANRSFCCRRRVHCPARRP